MCTTKVGSVGGLQQTQNTTENISGTLLKRSGSQTNIIGETPKKTENPVTTLTDEKLTNDQKSLNTSTLNIQKVDTSFIENITGKTSLTKPTSEQLQNVQLKATGVTLQDLDKKSEANLTELKDQHQKLSTDTIIDPVKPTENVNTNVHVQEISDIVANKFKGVITKLDSAISKDKIYKDAKVSARQMSASISPNGQLAKNLASMSDDDLKNEIAKSIGLIKDKHEGKTFTQLPENKQKLVNAICEGIKDGLAKDLNVKTKEIFTKYQSSNVKSNHENIKKEAQRAFQSCTKQERFDMSLMPEATLRLKIANDMGIKKDNTLTWFNKLPEKTQIIINSVHDGFKESFDTKFEKVEGNINIKNKEGRDISVPEKVFVGDVEYKNPIYLTQGGVGRVLKYTDQNTGKSVIVKDLLDKEFSRDEMIKEITNHKQAMGFKGHENVVNMLGISKGEDDNLYMILEEAKGGDMRSVIEKMNTSNDISDQTKNLMGRFMLKDVLNGMEYIQKERNIVHLDIKPENYLMNENGKAMVADFGSSKIGSEDFKDSTILATTVYASPEVSSRADKVDSMFINKKSDTWTLGMMVNELTGGTTSHFVTNENERDNQIMQRITDFSKDDSNRIRHTSDDKKNLDSSDNIVNALMHPDPSKRPTIKAALEHSFFQDPLLNDPNLEELMKEIVKPTSQQDAQKIKNLSDSLDKINPNILSKPEQTAPTEDKGSNWTKVNGKWQQS
jgi:serine/threonine protein kinase